MDVIYQCLVVDDEPLARRIIVRYLETLPWLHLAAECGNARAAAAFLADHPVDVMFLDIKMPGQTGFELLRTLSHPLQVILTTAYPEYAVAGYDYAVVDFLLKPIAYERFLQAVGKLRRDPLGPRETSLSAPRGTDDVLFMRADRSDHRIRYGEIRYLEAYGNYIKVHLDRGTILVAGPLAAMEARLPADRFLRIHKSFIIALERIDLITSRAVSIAGTQIPIGKSYRREVARIASERR